MVPFLSLLFYELPVSGKENLEPLLLFHDWFELHFLLSNLHLHSHEICLHIPVIMLDTLKLKSSVLFGMDTLLDKSIRASQLPKHLSNLTENE